MRGLLQKYPNDPEAVAAEVAAAAADLPKGPGVLGVRMSTAMELMCALPEKTADQLFQAPTYDITRHSK